MSGRDYSGKVTRSFWVETLGCPKNQVDSEKLTAGMLADGLVAARTADSADLVVVNTCAFIEEAREESIAAILDLDEFRSGGAELVVTGCMAERYGSELADALPEVDRVAGFGVPVTLSAKPSATGSGSAPPPLMDLLNMARPPAEAPWAYVKVAEGCDKKCGFCAIPSFRGTQVSRNIDSILDEVDQLAVREVVLIAQDLGAYGRDGGRGERRIVELVRRVSEVTDWVRLLYLYPSELSEELIETIAASPVPYFDLSLQHVSEPLVRRMRRPGSAESYLERIQRIRELNADSAFRSNFIVGYPGETEADQDALLEFVSEAQLDWCGFFRYSEEEGTYAADLDGGVPDELVADRLAELREIQDDVSAARRDALIGITTKVLVDEIGLGRSHREAPEIDGMIWVPESLEVGQFHDVSIVAAEGPDLFAELIEP